MTMFCNVLYWLDGYSRGSRGCAHWTSPFISHALFFKGTFSPISNRIWSLAVVVEISGSVEWDLCYYLKSYLSSLDIFHLIIFYFTFYKIK